MNQKYFKGTFNLNGQNIVLYTKTLSQRQAFFNFLYQMAIKYDMGLNNLRNLFNGQKDNYYIETLNSTGGINGSDLLSGKNSEEHRRG